RDQGSGRRLPDLLTVGCGASTLLAFGGTASSFSSPPKINLTERGDMIRWLLKLSSLTVLLALSAAGYAQEKLTILWAQWDPANYLQELVKDYQKETGVEVVVETTPWPDFQTKAFTEWRSE